MRTMRTIDVNSHMLGLGLGLVSRLVYLRYVVARR